MPKCMGGLLLASPPPLPALLPVTLSPALPTSDSVTKILLPLRVHQRVGDLLDLKLVEACAVCSFASIAKPADADLVEVRGVLPHIIVGLELLGPRIHVVRVRQSTTCPVAVAHTVVL